MWKNFFGRSIFYPVKDKVHSVHSRWNDGALKKPQNADGDGKRFDRERVDSEKKNPFLAFLQRNK